MDRKYQVFISSTFKDLVEQRNQVVEVVLRLSHLPVGMEIFNAASATPWDVIKSHIDNSDYYVLILAHRYGSEDPTTGIGYTEKEYDYAISRGIPCLGFVLKDNVLWAPELVEQKPGPKKKLAAFKKKVHVHHVSYWEDTKDLGSQVLLALVDEMRNTPGIGWVRANAVTASPVVAEELSRLSKENSELKIQLAAVEVQGNDEYSTLKRILTTERYSFTSGNESETITLKAIFLAICANQDAPFKARILQSLVESQQLPAYSQGDDITPAFQELSSLGLIKRDTNNSGRELWRLTDNGQKLYIRVHSSIDDTDE